ncbi:MAG: pyridoxal-phosphate dependent enzyme [Candidatus Dormiibacterota bacterium]
MTPIEGVDAARVHEIARLLAPHIRRTPSIAAPAGGFLKLESLQPSGSFKVRGFFAAAHVVDRERVARGLLTVSAGNAALACAYVARALHVPCRVVMFDTAPALKVDGVRALGAETVLLPRDRVFEWMATRAWERDPEVFIHPFADTAVITGHASIVPEILADLPDVERVVGDWAVVPETTLRRTVARMATELKVVAEGAGALGYAAMLDGRSTPRTVAIVSGGNLDGSRLGELLTEAASSR